MRRVKLVLLAQGKHHQYFPATYVVQFKQIQITQDMQRPCSKHQKCANFEENFSDHSILKLCFHC